MPRRRRAGEAQETHSNSLQIIRLFLSSSQALLGDGHALAQFEVCHWTKLKLLNPNLTTQLIQATIELDLDILKSCNWLAKAQRMRVESEETTYYP